MEICETPRVGFLDTLKAFIFCVFKFMKVFGSPVSVVFIQCGWLSLLLPGQGTSCQEAKEQCEIGITIGGINWKQQHNRSGFRETSP